MGLSGLRLCVDSNSLTPLGPIPKQNHTVLFYSNNFTQFCKWLVVATKRRRHPLRADVDVHAKDRQIREGVGERQIVDAYSGEAEQHSGLKPNSIPGRPEHPSERSDAGLLIVREVFGLVKRTEGP